MTEVPATPSVPVCGIGASAGGIEALQQFFGALPDDAGVAYVVVVHLAPDRKSDLPAILARTTTMPVVQVGDHDKDEIAPNTVYVIAPNRKLEITDTFVGASAFEQPRGQRNAIDLFFRSLAAAHGDGFAVILSGSGSDGALGARAVKEGGGLVLVQDPRDAAHGDMPRAVIATGVADLVLPARELAEQLIVLARNKERVIPVMRAATEPNAIPENEERALTGVLDVLRKRTGHDFSKYKRATVLRRLSRRMQLKHQLTIADYLEHLEIENAEVYALRDDLLISVTTFFRDPEAWAALQTRVIGPLVERASGDEQIRVWVPGCATGEEAYTLAILFHEEFERRGRSRNLLIFASDLDEAALAVAREGVYPRAISADVSDERLERYFHAQEDQYRVDSTLRDQVVFAVHNVLRDPPFSRLHLISCRNLLIYLDRELQEQLMAVFRYACRRDEAYLFLGASEMADLELFRPIDTKHRIFTSVEHASGERPALPELLTAAAPARSADHEPRPLPRPIAVDVHVAALEEAAPPSVVVDERWNVLHVSSSASRYFLQAGGPLARRLTDLVRPELRDELHAVLHRAVDVPAAQLSPFVKVTFNGTAHRVALLVQRHMHADDGQLYLLVTFLDGGESPAELETTDEDTASEVVVNLREKLRQAEQRIERMRDDHFLTNEDLRAANEELQSLNEEYRSTTEELETSKEELQSINEELQTVNHELRMKVDDLSSANADLENLMVATDVATLFLTADLRIRRHTPPLEAIFNIRSRDYDLPLTDQTHNLDYDALEADVRQVVATLAPLEREVSSRAGRVYVVRINPYRSSRSEAVEGAVLTFIDVTELRAAQQQIAGDLGRMTRLHELGALLAGPGDPRTMLEAVLQTAIDVTAADMGSFQRADEEGVLTLQAQYGFDADFLEFFARVDAHTDSACGNAIATRQRVIVADVMDSPIYAGSASRQVMLAAGVRACQSTPLFSRLGQFLGVLSTHYRAPHQFEPPELQWLDLAAQHAASVLERQEADEQLARAGVELEQRVAERTRWLALTHEVSGAINESTTWDDALQRIARLVCRDENWQIGLIYLPDSQDPSVLTPAVAYCDADRLRPVFAIMDGQLVGRGQNLAGRAYGDRVLIWIDDPEQLNQTLSLSAEGSQAAGLRAGAAVPITLGADVIAVFELLSDQPHPASYPVTTLLRDVGEQIARVLEREQSAVRTADEIWREQQNLLHTLHDSLGQTLTGLGMLSTGLRQRLSESNPAEAAAAEQIADQAQTALEQVRQMARNMFPVEVDPESLLTALRDLASTTESLHNLQVRVEGDGQHPLRNGKVATELYRIVQEAVTNAVKHAQAHTVVIRVASRPGILELRVTDDGVGLSSMAASDGMGMRIMRYRAASIGARLAIEQAPSGGTMVTCTLRESPGLDMSSG